MSEAAGEPEPVPGYSRAFEKLVQGPDDIVGLLAYATYKQSIREAAQDGRTTDRASRSLTPAMVSALRSSAEQVLTEIVNDGIAQATPDIQNTATLATLNSHHSEVLTSLQNEGQRLEGHITKRTGFWGAFGTNLAAWVLTLLVAVAILYLAGRTSVEATLSDAMIRGPAEKALVEGASGGASPADNTAGEGKK